MPRYRLQPAHMWPLFAVLVMLSVVWFSAPVVLRAVVGAGGEYPEPVVLESSDSDWEVVVPLECVPEEGVGFEEQFDCGGTQLIPAFFKDVEEPAETLRRAVRAAVGASGVDALGGEVVPLGNGAVRMEGLRRTEAFLTRRPGSGEDEWLAVVTVGDARRELLDMVADAVEGGER